jgi:hypothetical protein
VKIHGTKVGSGHTRLKIRVAESADLEVERELFRFESAAFK